MITIMSAGANHGEDQPADIRVSAHSWPRPPEAFRQMTGLTNEIQVATLMPNPVVMDYLRMTGEYARTLAAGRGRVLVLVECAEGLHRSVAGAMFLHGYLTELGEEVTVTHRDLWRAET